MILALILPYLSFAICHMEYRKQIDTEIVLDYDEFTRLQPFNNDMQELFDDYNKARRKTQEWKQKVSVIPGKPVLINVDGIVHFEINSNHPKYSKVKAFEKDFLKLLSMRGFKYVYKRDEYWRTWRQLADKERTLIRYRIGHPNMNLSCSHCHNMGYWIVEDGPPLCSFEIFSMIDSNKVCVTDITHFAKNINTCSEYSTIEKLKKSCKNPTITKWRFNKVYQVNERNLSNSKSAVCEEREKCEISTSYQFQPDQIVFRVINKDNNIIFSRIMRNNKRNYACVDSCGEIDLNTMDVMKLGYGTENPFQDKDAENEYEGVDDDSWESKQYTREELDEPNCTDCHNKSQDYTFVEGKPLINWKSRGFDFKDTVNDRVKNNVNTKNVLEDDFPYQKVIHRVDDVKKTVKNKDLQKMNEARKSVKRKKKNKAKKLVQRKKINKKKQRKGVKKGGDAKNNNVPIGRAGKKISSKDKKKVKKKLKIGKIKPSKIENKVIKANVIPTEIEEGNKFKKKIKKVNVKPNNLEEEGTKTKKDNVKINEIEEEEVFSDIHDETTTQTCCKHIQNRLSVYDDDDDEQTFYFDDDKR